ncbi:uncharacterized protein LOC101858678 [Aplysia californica]|uniref:Uncharacterized protein LOC101858678 n=1 Tax=Aplysia californica TaxID=6500 RepID=A0ABM0JBJ9_APLCA|nr:uncharacterized protein LOC101858678 [Aplysia californica]
MKTCMIVALFAMSLVVISAQVPEEAEQGPGPVPEEAQRGIPITKCTACKIVMSILEAAIDTLPKQDPEGNISEDLILSKLSEQCNILPKFLQRTCMTFVNADNVKLLLSLPSESVCRKIKLCRRS